MTDKPTPSRLEAKKIYLKDASFESPGTPHVFANLQAQPDIAIDIELSHARLEEKRDFHEIVLKITVTAKHKEKDDIVFLTEVQQAGVFLIQHPEQEKMDIMKEVACPHILLPFAREEISSLVSKGGFQQLLISPVNFEMLYLQKKRKKEATDAAKTPESTESN